MKKLIIFILIVLAYQATMGQSFSQQLVGSGGGQTDNPTYQTSWSVGEPITATAYAGSYTLTQGFHQGPSVSNPIWTGLLSTNWNTPGNWLGNIVPQPDEDMSWEEQHPPLLVAGQGIIEGDHHRPERDRDRARADQRRDHGEADGLDDDDAKPGDKHRHAQRQLDPPEDLP